MARRQGRRRPPEGVDVETPLQPLRAIALFEGLKGLVALLLAGGLLALLHRDVEQVAEQLLIHLHIGEEHALSRAFLRLAHGMTDRRIWAIAGGAIAYTGVRFTEAYGLWNRRVWAEWFALLSGTLYLPWEIYSVSLHPSILHYLIFSANLAIVLYMLYVRARACRSIFDCDD
ncbi:MAG TPA: DUF2127 domain-containing protein [Bryobacteraceae bacterium]|nr:DUF2127 domain-containing protein [Bryobacteraceae bacterium]